MDKVAALKGANGVPARPNGNKPDVDIAGHLLFEVCSEIGRQGTRCAPRTLPPPAALA